MDMPITVSRNHGPVIALANATGCRAYLVLGRERAALVDTMDGVGADELRATVDALAEGRRVEVLLTHRHADHVAGAYLFDEVAMSAADDGHWDEIERDLGEYRAAAVADGLVTADSPWPVGEGRRPRVSHVSDGDVLDLGGVALRCVALPGHTAGSVGFLVEGAGSERPQGRVLLSGDAVTPVMCLCFPESLSVREWQRTLRKMQGLDFDCFLTGHHDHAFAKDDLEGFVAAGDFALGDRGFEWHHSFVSEWSGRFHLCPCPTSDPDDPAFRAIICPPDGAARG